MNHENKLKSVGMMFTWIQQNEPSKLQKPSTQNKVFLQCCDVKNGVKYISQMAVTHNTQNMIWGTQVPAKGLEQFEKI